MHQTILDSLDMQFPIAYNKELADDLLRKIKEDKEKYSKIFAKNKRRK